MSYLKTKEQMLVRHQKDSLYAHMVARNYNEEDLICFVVASAGLPGGYVESHGQ